MTGEEIRRRFLEYFKKKDHRILRSSSLVPSDDPTLLFTNAGMVQFKRVFLGEENRGYLRATTSQKCVRAGGKHNDLENVGYTARHHTFFEMLGNFSFGDYFKEGAIEFAWDLLTNGFGFPPEKLWATIYLDDDEAAVLWQKVTGIPEDRIVRFGEKDNFWAMGDTGPCGPCSEIIIDRGEAYGCGKPDCRVGCECDRYLEIWNLVFMQFNRDASGKMTPLPKPSIDTGMGLERVVSVIQNVPTNFDTDLIRPIIRKVEELSERPFGASEADDVAMKVVADHSRAAAFLIGDGVLPSNEGRGYVLRRIMRRAIRYGRNIGLKRPFLVNTAEVVCDEMKIAYPELFESWAFIGNVIQNEEIRFMETLDHGLRLLNDTLEEMKAKGVTQVPGEVVFKLYDTYGFPVDIVRDVVRDKQLTLDLQGFDRAMEAQREKSRSTSVFMGIADAYKSLSASGFHPEFVGYDRLAADGRVVLLVQNSLEIEAAGAGETVEMVTEITPFYAESGGQVGDTGKFSGPAGAGEIMNTFKDPTGIVIHKVKILQGNVAKGQVVTLSVDPEKRQATALNHTATHILHAVLRRVLGDHVKQAGSLVSPDRLRFDFTHFSTINPEQLDEIEMGVNERIQEAIDVHGEEMDAEDAFKTGAMALFEEKYGDRVRVISLSSFSKELCGGTHIDNTGRIGLIKIIGESSVAAGVRRIEALTGREAIDHIQRAFRILKETAEQLKEKAESIPSRVEALLMRSKALEKEVERLKGSLAARFTEKIEEEIRTVNGVRVLSKKVSVDSPAALRELADRFRDHMGSGIVVLGSVADQRVLLIVLVTKDLTGRFHAGKIIKEISALVGGSGGGRPDMAQAGGNRIEKLDQALGHAYEILV
ncbi:MAG: alanine--tRNA ligase [Desulfobacterales bacterium CG07_land_8_20_14_0_80_52_14]|nr:MAG: alanine--tRNA ligase [Desulfobacterales bacterium CG23_combo_of_CG06-09_8_20_14_all_52_9]PIU49418.1 MAG: alanine--tRNA ligase [Desulfobacterales bacterium CG07_land_8_20_14_0_80_52_14]